MLGNPTEAREHGAKCLLIAETSTSPTVQQTFFDLAKQWARLANELQKALDLRDAVNKLDSKSEVRTSAFHGAEIRNPPIISSDESRPEGVPHLTAPAKEETPSSSHEAPEAHKAGIGP